jgi:hypothetical protein
MAPGLLSLVASGNSLTTPLGRDPADERAAGEPEVAVGPGRDPAADSSRHRERGGHVGGGHADDLAVIGVGDPEVAIGAGRDHPRVDAPGEGEEAHRAGRGDPPELLAVVVADGDVHVAVGPGRDPPDLEHVEAERDLGDLAGGGDLADLELAGRGEAGLSEIEVAVGAGRDRRWLAVGRRDRELGDDAGGGDLADLVGGGLSEEEVPLEPFVIAEVSVPDGTEKTLRDKS